MNRKQFLHTLAAAGALTAVAPLFAGKGNASGLPIKKPRAITMWDFSWLERRWPGAGYEDWDQALDELVERGYDAIRIDAYPHLVAADGEKSWLLKPVWDTQDWGSPTLVRVRVLPELIEFMAKCRTRGIKIGLSTWYREDEDNIRLKIAGPEQMAEIWNITLAAIKRAGLFDTILYVDLCNEWPGEGAAPFVKPPLAYGQWADPRSLKWMRTAIAQIRAEYPELPLFFSSNLDRVEEFSEHDADFDAIDHHIWMVGENEDEFYKRVGYNYERFSQTGYHNVQLKAASVYAEKPEYWHGLLNNKIDRLSKVARKTKLPLIATEGWAIVDYKDWPMLPWDWVKNVCALGTLRASATEQWAAICTSNFCGPQFRGMWRDVEWHQNLTQAVKGGGLDPTLRKGRLYGRL